MRLALLIFALLLTSCAAATDATHDDGGFDAGADAGLCGAKPSPNLPACREGCGYACRDRCNDICAAGGCWQCQDSGQWVQSAIDCEINCP
jgi:hypothetical protein